MHVVQRVWHDSPKWLLQEFYSILEMMLAIPLFMRGVKDPEF